MSVGSGRTFKRLNTYDQSLLGYKMYPTVPGLKYDRKNSNILFLHCFIALGILLSQV